MTDTRLEFYDPLYETITFQKGLPSNRAVLNSKRAEYPLDPRDIVQTAEFARLAFLRQAGLAWLVFPSATHTRFSHSIGCWWLGRIAETLIKIKGKVRIENTAETERSLHLWLKETSLREEFYLGLLFHDLGHGPLSHVLERNRHFTAGLKAAGLDHADHEHRGAILLEGKGPLVEAWRETASRRYGKDVKILADIKLDKLRGVCFPAILYLITKNPIYLDQCAHSHKEFLGLLKELVSGLLDLDRLDHYARDSYFSGLRQVSINVRGFLNNLCLTYVDNEENGDKKAHFWLTRDGGFYAASLLFGKRQIISTMFRNPRTVAFHTMANWSLSAYLEDLSDPSTRSKECLRIAMMEDDQFLEMIVGAAHEGCRYVGQRIRAMQPYICVGKLANTEITVNKKSLRRDLDEYTISQGENGSPKVILHYDDGFWELGRAKDSTDWLDTGFLLLEDTKKPLTDHPDHRDNFLPLRDADKIKYLWVFARDKEDVEKIKRDIRDICGGTAQCVS